MTSRSKLVSSLNLGDAAPFNALQQGLKPSTFNPELSRLRSLLTKAVE